MREPRTMAKIAPAAALAALAVFAFAVWAVRSDTNQASANHTLSVGLDFNPSGTPANGIYNPAGLPTFETCRAALLGSQTSIDLFVLDVQLLTAFSSHIQYDGAKLQLVGSQVRLFMDSPDLQNLSQNNPDPTTGVLATPDSDGLYEAAAVEAFSQTGGHTGYGVLARITFQATASGSATVRLPSLDLNGDGTLDTGVLLRDANAVSLNDANGDGWYDGPFTNQQGTIAVGQDNDGDGLPDVTCPGGGTADNCPNVNNPDQADMDADGLGDACDWDIDGDGYGNTATGSSVMPQESDMGSDPRNKFKTPEVCDGVDNDGDGLIDEGYDRNSNGVPDCSDPAADTDGDGIPNPTDSDDDNDGFSDVKENWMGIDSLAKCSTNTTHYAWAPDVNNDKTVNIFDVVRFRPAFFTTKGVSREYNARVDLNADSKIDILDVVGLAPYFFKGCTP